jgi:hypothetical protein
MLHEHPYTDTLARLQELTLASDAEIELCYNLLSRWGDRFGRSRMQRANQNLIAVLESIRAKVGYKVIINNGDMLEINILSHIFTATGAKVIDSDSQDTIILPGCRIVMHYFAPGDESRRSASIHVIPDE